MRYRESDEYLMRYCSLCRKKTEHDRCTGRCVCCGLSVKLPKKDG